MVPKAVVFVGAPRPGEWHTRGRHFALSGVAEAPALVPVANRPYLFRVLDSLAQAEVEEAVLVTDRRDESAVTAAVTGADDWPFPVRCVSGPSKQLGTGSVLLHLGDGLGELPVEPVDAEIGSLDAVLFTDTRETGSPPAGLGRLRAVSGENGSPAPLAGAALLGAGAVELAAEQSLPAHPETALLALVERLETLGGKVTRRPAGEWWRCHGGSDSLLEGNDFVLEKLTRRADVTVGDRNQISGSVVIDPSAKVESSVIRGPVVIGERASVRDAYLGPCTSIGPDVEIEGAEIERSIVFAGACISHLGARLEGSVIGPRAHVFRDFRLPRALRLEVGGEAQIALS